jgi:hypothetical protein
LLLVGIAGGVPDAEFTLGDVLLASRVHDFSVSAAIEGGQSSYQQLGGPVHRDLEPMLAHRRYWGSAEAWGRCRAENAA